VGIRKRAILIMKKKAMRVIKLIMLLIKKKTSNDKENEFAKPVEPLSAQNAEERNQ